MCHRDLLAALVSNNLGYVLKLQSSYEAALESYQQAYQVRCKLLKEDHADVVVTMNNIAEVLLAKGSL